MLRSKFGGISVPDAERLKEPETENARLKMLLAGQVLENEVMKDERSGWRTGSTRAGALHCGQGGERAPGTGRGAHERQCVPLCPSAGP